MAPESSTRFGRVHARHDRGSDVWSSSAVVRLLAGCALCVAGVIAIVPRAGSEGGRGLNEGPAPSGVFLDVKVPAATVPVSIGRVIGAGPASNSKFDAQVTSFEEKFPCKRLTAVLPTYRYFLRMYNVRVRGHMIHTSIDLGTDLL